MPLLTRCAFVASFVGACFSASPAESSAASAPTTVWSQLYSTDIVTYAGNLRRAGFPAETIGLLISEAVNERFKDEEASLRPSLKSPEDLRKFWSSERRDALAQIYRDKNELLRAALGAAPGQQARADWVEKTFPQLSAEVRDKIRAIADDYDELVNRLLTNARGHLMDDDREMLRFLDTERKTDLRRVLSEQQYTDYVMARSRYASLLRFQLQCFDPTPDEMRTCLSVGIKHGLDVEVFGTNMDRQRELQKAMDEEIGTLWGAERFQLYRRAKTYRYQSAFHLVRRLNLPIENAAKIFDSEITMSEAMTSAMTRPRPGRSLGAQTPAEAAERAKTIRAEMMAERAEGLIKVRDAHLEFVRSLLGDAGLKEYIDLNQRWIEGVNEGRTTRFTIDG